jgi:Holliday junction resolvase-like predicted endonuclease
MQGVNNAKQTGNISEQYAAHYLQAIGMVMWKSHVTSRYGEIDLIGFNNQNVYLVEVKTVRTTNTMNLETLNKRKFSRMIKTWHMKKTGCNRYLNILIVLIRWSYIDKYAITIEHYPLRYEDWH